MFQYNTLLRTFFSLIFAFAFFGSAFFFGASVASAAMYEVVGWGWAADNNKEQLYCHKVADPINGIPADPYDLALDYSGPVGFRVLTPRPDCTLNGLGWVSFSNKTDSTAIPYGVFIDGVTGNFSGYAWSANTGWITFNAAEMQKCATNLVLPTPPSVISTPDNCPTPSPSAQIAITSDPVTGVITGGTGNVTGWARACSVFVSGCSGNLRSDSRTGLWDGWINLRKAGYNYVSPLLPGWSIPLDGNNYGIQLDIPTMKFLGPTGLGSILPSNPVCATCFAYTGNNASTAIPSDRSGGFGWGMNLGGLSVSLVSASLSPLLSFWADQTTLVSGQSTNLHWITSSSIISCTAGSVPFPSTPALPSWNGAKLPAPAMRTQATPALTVSQAYTLQCTDGINPPLLRTVDITVAGVAASVDGVCGSANGVSSRTAPSANLCSSGNSTAVTKDTTVTPNLWRWGCLGINGGVDATPACSSGVKKSFRIIQI